MAASNKRSQSNNDMNKGKKKKERRWMSTLVRSERERGEKYVNRNKYTNAFVTETDSLAAQRLHTFT